MRTMPEKGYVPWFRGIWYLGKDICFQPTYLFDVFRVGLGYEPMSSNDIVYAQQHLNNNTLLINSDFDYFYYLIKCYRLFLELLFDRICMNEVIYLAWCNLYSSNYITII